MENEVQSDVDLQLKAALEFYQAGQLYEAATIYSQLPDNAEASYFLGVIAYRMGKNDLAIKLINTAIAINPGNAGYYCDIGVAYHASGQFDEAVASYRKALVLLPDFAMAHNNLGNVLKVQGKLSEAVESFQRALVAQPDFLLAHNNLGNALKDQGNLDAAVCSYQAALALQPNFVEALNNLGVTLDRQGELDQAVESYRKALALSPDFVELYNNLGCTLNTQGRLDEAAANFNRALELRPNYAEAYNNLGRTLVAQGRTEEAITSFRRALEIQPDYVKAYSNLLLAMLCSTRFSADELFAAHTQFGIYFEAFFKPYWQPHDNLRDPSKKLRIGYVSPDFRRHSVTYLIESLFENHDHSQLEVFCYYNHTDHDDVTKRFQKYADHWLSCVSLTDQQLAQQIRDDGIDLLVDLVGHSAGNRLLMFARKPAPVQVTYVGYPGTTGLTAMDYRITDHDLDPPGLSDQYNVEKLWRLPDMVTCYRADDNSPDVTTQAPFENNGYLTFGCFNNFTKVSDAAISLWARILDAVPDSRLMLEIAGLDSVHFRQEVEARLQNLGVPLSRLILKKRCKENQFVLYNQIDIALDPFPYNGGTTSFDTLWMGVPLVTLAGTHCVSRMGVSTLTNAGLPELIADTEARYAEIAVALASDRAWLKRVRLGLRQKMQASPLMDGKRFTENMEHAYRTMWASWCK